MATPADQRLLELLDKWLQSLDLHLKYSSLDDDGYSRVQPWPPHQRPSRWIIELARQNASALRTQVQERIDRGDTTFADSLELMAFLANLVGAEHIERFIPLANAATERDLAAASDSDAPRSASITGTREMPQFVAREQRPPEPIGTADVARTERKNAPPPADRDLAAQTMHDQVIADAARLVQWGRKWYELAELISSMANRPSLIEVRRILQDNKTLIDKKAGRS